MRLQGVKFNLKFKFNKFFLFFYDFGYIMSLTLNKFPELYAVLFILTCTDMLLWISKQLSNIILRNIYCPVDYVSCHFT